MWNSVHSIVSVESTVIYFSINHDGLTNYKGLIVVNICQIFNFNFDSVIKNRKGCTIVALMKVDTMQKLLQWARFVSEGHWSRLTGSLPSFSMKWTSLNRRRRVRRRIAVGRRRRSRRHPTAATTRRRSAFSAKTASPTSTTKSWPWTSKPWPSI